MKKSLLSCRSVCLSGSQRPGAQAWLKNSEAAANSLSSVVRSGPQKFNMADFSIRREMGTSHPEVRPNAVWHDRFPFKSASDLMLALLRITATGS